MPIIGVETYQDRQFIVIWCPGGDNTPYSSPKTMEKDNKERIYYIRKASNTVKPSDDEEKDLFNMPIEYHLMIERIIRQRYLI